MKQIILAIVFLACATNLFTLQASIRPKGKKENLPKVYTQKLNIAELSNEVTYWGHLAPAKVAKIYSPIDGIVVDQIIQRGNFVKKGEIISIIKQNIVGLDSLPLKVRAPMDGYLFEQAISENSFVTQNTLLYQLYDPQEYKLKLHLPPADAKLIKIKDKAAITVDDKNLEGFVTIVNPFLDSDTGTMAIELLLSNQENLLAPGMVAAAKFNFNKHSGFLVDEQYIKKQGDKNVLRLLEKNNLVTLAEVEIKSSIRGKVEITANTLVDGLTIITKSSVEPLAEKQEVNIFSNSAK